MFLYFGWHPDVTAADDYHGCGNTGCWVEFPAQAIKALKALFFFNPDCAALQGSVCEEKGRML